jgi:homoserine O-acetyltransferase/O-succinyltransferase
VLGLDWLDGGRADDGRPARIVTTHDQADALAAVLDALGIARAHALVGASYGGMVALAFAERYPERVDRLVVVSAAHETHPMSTALRAVQRRVVELGLETGRARDALALARALAMTTYRGVQEFAERFDSRPDAVDERDATFPVERYIRHQGEKFAATWRPERFLALSLSADLHRVDPAAVRVPTTLVAAEGDAIVPGEQMEELARRLAAPSTLVHLATRHGHDAFLTDADAIGRILTTALSSRSLA